MPIDGDLQVDESCYISDIPEVALEFMSIRFTNFHVVRCDSVGDKLGNY